MGKISKGLAAGAIALLTVSAAACGSGDTGSAGDAKGATSTDPIVVGAISSLSGPAAFPEASQAAKAVFDRVNAQGGVNGRKISYVSVDDKGDPSTAAQASRDLIQNKGAVALAGGASLLDCQVNGAFYAQSGISSISGTGIDPGCFTSPAISPVNTGPFLGTTVTLYHASEVMKIDKLCGFFVILGGTSDAYKGAVEQWSKITGKQLLINDRSLSGNTTDYTPYILRARDAGCKGVVFNGTEPMSVGWVKAAQAQGVTGIKWLVLTSTYTDAAAKAFGDAGKDVVALSEFEPYSDTSSEATKDWRELMTQNKVPLTSFAEGGYLAATNLVTALKGVKGDITRESVTAALKALPPIESPMVGTPYAFGPDQAHSSNRAAKFVQPDNGSWKVMTPDWIRLPNA
ncbi:ABC transporter substrate-binding protein [Streptosporangium algeriense]|uniref:ABC transporter substrate-binding protein n=1 Tax=Streptosporangium algeriense TaxID=1682748 RepID=A0ABW3DSR5_9ACTN